MIAEILARLLEIEERDAVLGDLTESGSGPARAALEVARVVALRQVALWKTWRPWVALFGLAIPGAVLFNNLALTVGGAFRLYYWIWQNYADMDPAALRDTGFTLQRGIATTIWFSLLLCARGWFAGYALAAFAGKTLWLSSAVFALAFTAMSFAFGRSLLTFGATLVAASFVSGIRARGRLLAAPGPRTAIAAIAAVLFEVYISWLGLPRPFGLWGVRQALVNALSLWPAGFVVMEFLRARMVRRA
ncbi:MAG: hypothetical protein U0Q16_18100 [Bryobacteraceae bacterium]